jgi:hypothetical protein
MSVIDLHRYRPTPAAPSGVRDRLASDVDNRLVVRTPEPRPAPRETRSWPVPRRVRHLPVGWPIAAAIAGYPIWWALGLASLVFPLCAVPVAWQLAHRRHVKVPPGFWIWVLFLVLVALSVFAINVDLPGSAKSVGLGRYFAFGFRYLTYLAITVMLLFVGNTTEEELPRRRVIRWFSILGLVTIALALLSLVAPTFGYVAPSAYVLPGWLQADGSAVVKLSQVQPVLDGVASPRPSAPFAFTNAWGNCLSLLLIWLVVSWGVLGSKRRRLALYLVLAVAVVPIVYSLNRAMWMGIGLAVVVVAVRLALRGLVKALIVLVLGLTVGAVAFSASPLGTMVQARFDNGHSNEVRGSLLDQSINAAKQSPVIGFGSTRNTLGSDASIAIGPSQTCPRCGSRTVGSTGQFTLLLISQGFLGIALYAGFLLVSILRHVRDHSVIGIAATLVVGLELFYGGFYAALSVPLAITFLSIALLWRNDTLRAAARTGAAT